MLRRSAGKGGHQPQFSSTFFFPQQSLRLTSRRMKNSGHIALSQLITRSNINLNLKSTNTEGVLEELVNQISAIAKQPEARQTLLRALHEREQLHSTGIGDGVALPHARNALVGLVDRPVIVFGRSTTGISFGAIDGEPSKLFFLLVAPTVTEHLSALARLSRVLRDPKVRHELLAVDTPEKALVAIREAESKLLS
jgi:mannitol/fructose-specific phosphotransferase system IIA component (Ntr-type)